MTHHLVFPLYLSPSTSHLLSTTILLFIFVKTTCILSSADALFISWFEILRLNKEPLLDYDYVNNVHLYAKEWPGDFVKMQILNRHEGGKGPKFCIWHQFPCYASATGLQTILWIARLSVTVLGPEARQSLLKPFLTVIS